MSTSYQNEIPKARINITLDLETGGSKKKVELPLSLLVLGDFSNGKTEGSVVDREKININKENLNQVLADLGPEVTMTLPNKIKNDDTELKVSLKFNNMKSFHPEGIISQVPELKKLLAMRNLLKEFRANVMDNSVFRKKLEELLKHKEGAELLNAELKKIAIDDAANDISDNIVEKS